MDDSSEIGRIIEQLRTGRREGLDRLLHAHRDYLRAVAGLRLNPVLQARIDPSDIVQEVLLEAAQRIDDFLARGSMPFRVWLRLTLAQHLRLARRRHLDAACRTVTRHVHLPADSSLQLAGQVLGKDLAPLDQLIKQELAEQVQAALDGLSETDQEVLVMRHFEGLGINEIAQALEIEPKAASKRYGRALRRLTESIGRNGTWG